MQPLIDVQHVSKRYRRGGEPVLEDVNLKIFKGEKIGVVGGNGSGKTTLIRLILNFIFPDEGTILCEGKPGSSAILGKMGYVPERQEGLHNFSPRELFQFAGEMNGMERDKLLQRIEEVLVFTKLELVADRFLDSFSKGMIQRAQIGAALIHQPEILLLDEPLSGLDPEGQKEVGELLENLSGITLLMASHNLEQIETFCDAVVIIRQGKVVRRVSLDEMKKLVVTLDLDENGYQYLVNHTDLAIEVVEENERFKRLRFQANPEALQKMLAALDREGIQAVRLRSRSILSALYQEEQMVAGR